MKISGVYKITNKITNDFYIGSSKDVKRRFREHKSTARWKKHPNNQLYLDMQKYGVDKFDFQILDIVEQSKLKETEQQFIEKMKPTYNSYRAKGQDTERYKKYQKSEKHKECIRKYNYSEKHKENCKKYLNQLCFYNGETLTLNALCQRFYRAGAEHPTLESKKYLLDK